MRIGIIHDICRVQKPGKKFSPKTAFLDTLLLTPIYSWFTEGFDTTDLQEAKTLLEELGA